MLKGVLSSVRRNMPCGKNKHAAHTSTRSGALVLAFCYFLYSFNFALLYCKNFMLTWKENITKALFRCIWSNQWHIWNIASPFNHSTPCFVVISGSFKCDVASGAFDYIFRFKNEITLLSLHWSWHDMNRRAIRKVCGRKRKENPANQQSKTVTLQLSENKLTKNSWEIDWHGIYVRKNYNRYNQFKPSKFTVTTII